VRLARHVHDGCDIQSQHTHDVPLDSKQCPLLFELRSRTDGTLMPRAAAAHSIVTILTLRPHPRQ
jgi:hypothetical protein